jgi:hypothetical protein
VGDETPAEQKLPAGHASVATVKVIPVLVAVVSE